MAIVKRSPSRLRVPDEQDAPPAVQALFDKASEKLGFVPNVLRVYALRPRHLELWNAFYDDLMRGDSGLTKAQREMIAVVVSTVNRCHYCMVSHAAYLRKLTGDPILVEQLRTSYKYADLEPRERAMLDFAVKLTEWSAQCTEDDVAALRDAGWTDEDVMDIAEVTGMFNFTNRLASGLGWVPNDEFATLGVDVGSST
ncbi:MAG: peroxidase-related enzyme [Verrucomicrobiota bacterium]